MAMEQARRLSNDGQRVALICYSHGLASYAKRIAQTGRAGSNRLRRRVPHPRHQMGRTARPT